MSDAAAPDARLTTARRVSFVTGSLAEPALRRVLAEMAPPFAYDVAVLKITVAALMTTEWIGRTLTVPPGTDLVLIPGLCEGDPAALGQQAWACRWRRGRRTCARFPTHFGRVASARDYGDYDIEILAEINNAPRLSRRELRAAADGVPRRRRRRHRHRLHARPSVSRSGRRRARAGGRRACA